jgi:AraC family L-rhamnose operon transcriptional activator RhaR
VDPSLLDPPVERRRSLLYFTDGSMAYAGHYLHEGVHDVHTHSFVEIAVVTGGAGVHHCLAGRQRLRVGDVLLLRPGVWHGYEECERLDLYNCCFTSELLHRELAWTREDPLLSYLLWTGPHSMQRRGVLTAWLAPAELDQCQSHLEALDQLRFKPTGLHRGDIIGRLSLFLSHLARAVANDRDEVIHPTGPTHPAVVQAMRLLEADPARQWTLTQLAGELHIAPGYLVRIFKTATGLPPIAYLARFRIETAAALLLHTGEPIAQIGHAVGWPDQNYFARRFKAHYGLTASTYRRHFARNAAQLRSWPAEEPAGESG